jgi:hypothetical protein
LSYYKRNKLKLYERAKSLKNDDAKLQGLKQTPSQPVTEYGPPYDLDGGNKMNKKNKRKNAPRIYIGYLTSKQRKAVEWYEQKRKESELKVSELVLDIIRGWHNHKYRKCEYLERGCINILIRKELQEKKLYHYKRYAELSLNYEEKVKM